MTTEKRVWPTLKMAEIHWMHPPSCLSLSCAFYIHSCFPILIICFSTTQPRTNLNSAAATFILLVSIKGGSGTEMSDVEPEQESQLSNPSPSGRLVLGPVLLWFIPGSVTGSRSKRSERRKRRSCLTHQATTKNNNANVVLTLIWSRPTLRRSVFYVSLCCAINNPWAATP
ncbi:hypothetical protein VNO80_18385 [Phaseolus coccineus]|uniref:Uncharacterized protein n=1 Tax=Phaseolus coccineus TaxID=3886 RepID=A0AAN9R3U8_PHACN